MINYGTVTAMTMDISSLATSSTFLGGYESNEVDNTTTRWDDFLVNVDGILGHASTAPVVGQQIQLYVWGSDVSLATTPIDVLDGTASAETLAHDAVRQSLRSVSAPAVTVATAALKYYVQPFSIAQFFGGNCPTFWGLFLAHNHAGALAGAQSGLFSYQGIKYTAT
jgi:hypothetical protein